jgi:hypothetical protein
MLLRGAGPSKAKGTRVIASKRFGRVRSPNEMKERPFYETLHGAQRFCCCRISV